MTDTEVTVVAPSVLAKVFAPEVRAIVYVLTVMAAAAYAVVEANVEIPYGVLAGYAAWNAFAGVLAAANTTTLRGPRGGAGV